MPLKRGVVGAYDSDRGIVRFSMRDRSRAISCGVTTAAMDELEGANSAGPSQRRDQFLRLRGRVEEAASRIFDAGRLERETPVVLVRTGDFSDEPAHAASRNRSSKSLPSGAQATRTERPSRA